MTAQPVNTEAALDALADWNCHQDNGDLFSGDAALDFLSLFLDQLGVPVAQRRLISDMVAKYVPDSEPEFGLCGHCGGSGEGQTERAVCSVCHGGGEVRVR